MTELLVLFTAAAVTAALLWTASRTLFEAPTLQRRNHRGIDVPVAAGVLLVSALVVIEAVLRTLEIGIRTVEPAEWASRSTILVLALGFGMLGAFDDLAAHGDDRGFRGHLTAMAGGRLSTGGLKLVVGGLLAVIVVAPLSEGILDVVVAGLLIALAANLANLFDRAPGRTIKVALLTGVIVAVTTSAAAAALAGPALVLGAAAGLLAFDLRERLMLGDAGSNVIGAALGYAFVITHGLTGRLVTVAVLLALNLLSERISFSTVIRSTPPLRVLDELGRRRA